MNIGEEILKKKGGEWNYVHDAIIERIGELYIACPECENIVLDDEQYQCGTCNGGSQINVLDYLKNLLK